MNMGRGYIQGRFRGKDMAYLESEYRFGLTNNGLLGYFQFLQSQLSPLQMILTMPKFSYSYSIENMQPTLGSMGMDLAFERNADFSLMYNVPAYLSTAVHKTFIEVDEEGTVAAAATGVGVVTATVPAIPFIRFDHPFVYIIQEKTSGVILFTGVVNDPTLP